MKNLVGLGEDRVQDRDEVSGCGEVWEAKHGLELLKAHHCGSSAHEPYNGCMGEEVHYEP